MAVSYFDDKAVVPDEAMVASALRTAYPISEELRSHVEGSYPSITAEWKHYGKSAGWSCKLLSKKRNLLFFVPLENSFRLRIVLGDKAVACLEAVPVIPEDVKEAFRAAKPYSEGRSIDIDITQIAQLETIKKLLEVKFES